MLLGWVLFGDLPDGLSMVGNGADRRQRADHGAVRAAAHASCSAGAARDRLKRGIVLLATKSVRLKPDPRLQPNSKERKRMDKPRIGFIGVGLMGHGIAKNLVTKAFR
jgi:hypothetical protein